MSRFLEKQLASAEAKKLGRETRSFDYDEKKKAFVEHYGRADAAKAPPLVTTEEFPVGRKRGIVKP